MLDRFGASRRALRPLLERLATAVTGPEGAGALPNAALVMFDGATSFPLIAIPLFILAGAIMNASGISRRLIAFASAVVGFIRGGLSMVTISASAMLMRPMKLS